MSLPLLLALDYGGVLYWTQYVAALAIVVAFALAIPSLFGRENARGIKQHWMLFPILAWGVYSFFQTIPLPAGIVGLLSPASSEAYTTWIAPFLPADEMPSMFPITVDQHASEHATAILWILAALTWTSAVVFTTRRRLTALLSTLAISGTTIAAIGIARRLVPGFELWSFTDTGVPFATFVNRNNAALFLNLGLASGLGLLAWRTSALTGQDVDDPDFEFSDLVSLTSDIQSMIGILAIVFCSAGLAIGGSRGGLVAAIAGMLLAFGWVRQRRGVSTIAVVGVAMAIGIGVLTIPTDLSLDSIQRLDFNTRNNHSTILRDGRIAHWPDGLRTATAHLPAGSGMGTYGHAYLPHQESTKGGWYEHADNLWLELLVEQGVYGILLFISVLAVAIFALSTLAESPDAIDHGLRIAGWFSIGAIFVSQLFDFGLIMPANFISVAMLFAAVMKRSANNATAVHNIGVGLTGQNGHVVDNRSDDDSRKRDAVLDVANNASRKAQSSKSLFENKRVRLASLGLPAIVLLSALACIPRLMHDATAQSLAFRAKTEYGVHKGNPNALRLTLASLNNGLMKAKSTLLSKIATDYDARLARFNEVDSAHPANDLQRAKFFELTSPKLRGVHDSDNRETQSWMRYDSSHRHYVNALDRVRQTLLWSPLDRSSRWELARLDFAHSKPTQSQEAVRQLIEFNKTNAFQSLLLGREAIAQDTPETATLAFRRALEIRPQYARNIFADIRDSEELSFETIFPNDSTAYQSVADLTLAQVKTRHSKLSTDQLRHIRDNQGCDKCETMSAKVTCLVTLARLSYAMGDFTHSYATFDELIQLRPRESSYRAELVRLLVQQDELELARKHASQGKELFPDIPYFRKALDKVIASELQIAP